MVGQPDDSLWRESQVKIRLFNCVLKSGSCFAAISLLDEAMNSNVTEFAKGMAMVM